LTTTKHGQLTARLALVLEMDHQLSELAWYVAVILFPLIFIVIEYARWNYGTLEQLNIPVVSPSFIFGSDPQGHGKVQHLEDYRRVKEFGSVYGVH